MSEQSVKVRCQPLWRWIALLSAVSFFVFRHNTAHHPYYATHDMDQVTALDVLLVQGGVLPDQVTHPAAGMYLMLSWSQWLGWLVGLVQMRDYTAIYTWANPLLGVAELIEFLRAHLAVLAVATALLFTFAVAKVTKGGSLFVIFVFLCFAGSRSLAYQTILFRTDLFALFYVSCSLFAAVAAVGANRTWRSFALTIASGIFSGLAFTTKVQIIPIIAAVPLLALLMMLRESSLSAFSQFPRRSNQVVAACSITLYVALVALSFFIELPEQFYHYRTSFSVTPLCIVTGLALVFPVALTEFFKKPESLAYRFGSFANLMGLGVVLSIPLLMLTFSSAATGAFYASSIFKIAFLGSVDTSLLAGQNLPSLWQHFTAAPILFLAPAAMLGTFAVSQRRSSNHGELAVLGTIFLLFLLSAMAFNRGMHGQDIIVSEPLSLLLSAVLLHAMWKQAIVFRLAAAGVSVLLAINVIIQSQPAPLIDAQFSGYFQETRQLMTAYGRGNQGLFEGEFRRLFVQTDEGLPVPIASRDAIFDQTANYRAIVSQVEFTLPNLRVDRGRIGVVAEGLSPFGHQRLAAKFSKVGHTFDGATSYVPQAAAPFSKAEGLGRWLVRLGVHSIESDALLHIRPELIRTRLDLSVFVLVPTTMKDQFEWPSEGPAEIGVGDQTYVAVPIPAYPPDELLRKLKTVNDRIIVIKRKHA
ncbi:hypothetical protein [Bradyrhizobium sp. 482_C4_N1_8]|uniref:hypothetical protein n=1 Tax=Bradyrhizobium sp. 482_C4_N1_8 TaxID=3240367 RepID=UPI003F89078F